MGSHISPSNSPRWYALVLGDTATTPTSPIAVPKAPVSRHPAPPPLLNPSISSTATTATTTTAANRPSQVQQPTPSLTNRTATAPTSSHRLKQRRRHRESLHYNLLQRRHLAQESAVRGSVRGGREIPRVSVMAENNNSHHADGEGEDKGEAAFMQSFGSEWIPAGNDSEINLNAGLANATLSTAGPVLAGSHTLHQQQAGYNASQKIEAGLSQRAQGIFCSFTCGSGTAVPTPSEQLAAQRKELEQREAQLRLAMRQLFFDEARVRRDKMLLERQRKAFHLEQTTWRNAQLLRPPRPFTNDFCHHPIPSFSWNPAGLDPFTRPVYPEPFIQVQFAEGNGPLLPPRPFTGDGLYQTPPPWPLAKMKESFKLYDTCWNKLHATDGKICYPTLTGRSDGLVSCTYITHLPPDHDKHAVDVTKVSESLAFIIKQNVWAFFLAAFDLTPRYKTSYRYNNSLCDPSMQPYQTPILDLSKAPQSNIKELKAHLHLKETRRWHQDKLGCRFGLPAEETELRKALWNAIDELKKRCENAVVGGVEQAK